MNLGNLITLGTLIISIAAFVWKIKADKEKLSLEMNLRVAQVEKEHEKDVVDLKEKLMSVQHGKKAMKKELIDAMEKMEGVMHGRIDRVRDDNIKSYEKLEVKIGHLETKMESNTEKVLLAIGNIKSGNNG